MLSGTNSKLLENYEAELKDHLTWQARSKLTLIYESAQNYRNLKQFVVGLSIAVLGLVFPSLIVQQSLAGHDYFILSFVLLSIVTVWGLIDLIVPVLTEPFSMQKTVDHHIGQTLAMIKRVQAIGEMKDNNEAGLAFAKLPKEYKHLDLGEPYGGFLGGLYRRYEDSLFYGLFLVSFALLVLGLFQGFSLL